jgi:molybdate transport system substrate-binding protein
MPLTREKTFLCQGLLRLRIVFLAIASSALAISALAISTFATSTAQAGQVSVAVASNFIVPMKEIASLFSQATGHTTVLNFGSTAKFYAQIVNGAPYQILLAADATTPLRLEQERRAVAGSRFTYAIGRLVLWSLEPKRIDAQAQVLQTGDFAKMGRLAMADPELAPYGLAARQTLVALGQWSRLQPHLIYAENIAQAHQFVQTGNAAAGFIALSQVMTNGQRNHQGSSWTVPAHLHAPIRQDAVLLRAGENQAAAHALLQYLKTPKARAILHAYGYEDAGE